MKRFLFLGALISTFFFGAKAQDWYQMHVDYDDYEWKFPVNMTHVSYFDFNSGQTVLQPHFTDDENVVIPFSLEASKKYGSSLTTMTLSNELTEWGKNKHKVFAVYITTDDGSDITSKEEYTPCYISVDGMGEYPDHSMHGKIRGRGNSTWEWYDKKPYRIKFDVSSKVLGIKKNKDWVLLANYRDVTKVMNTFASITADWMGLPFTTPVRFAELFINGEYKGIYQIAEQVEVGGNRVAIDEMEGLLLTLDVDDGPGNNPGAGDNFWTKVYNMPMAVKNPKNLTADQLNDVREQFAELEQAIKSQDYEAVDNLMDIGSYIRMIQLQEYLYNVELSAPRSVFLFRDKGGKFTFGPAWDWDAGFDFEWSDMYTGHTYFANYRETLLGSRPYDRNGTYKVSHFFTDLFGVGDFVRLYKSTWENFSDSIFIRNWEETQKYIDGINEYQQRKSRGPVTPSTREADRWPIRNFKPRMSTRSWPTIRNPTEVGVRRRATPWWERSASPTLSSSPAATANQSVSPAARLSWHRCWESMHQPSLMPRSTSCRSTPMDPRATTQLPKPTVLGSTNMATPTTTAMEMSESILSRTTCSDSTADATPTTAMEEGSNIPSHSSTVICLRRKPST